MITPHSTDDLRHELRLQAREAEEWDLPAVAFPRRTPPRRAWTVLAVSAALVAAVLVVPGWLGGSVRPIDPSGGAARSPAAAPRLVDFEPVGNGLGTCTPYLGADPGTCRQPLQVLTEGRELDFTSGHVLGADAGDGLTLAMDPVPADGYWLMAGDDSGGPRPTLEVSVDDGPGTVVPAGEGLALVELPVPASSGRDIDVTRPDGATTTGTGEPVVLGLYSRSVPSPRDDWSATLAACREAGDGCRTPETIRLDADDLVRVDQAGAATDGTLRGSLDDPPAGAWLLLGDLDGRRGQTLTLRFDGSAPVFVDAGKPVLLRLPDDGPVDYAVTTRATGTHRLVAATYEPATD